MRTNWKRGFTLIELLIVIAIIGILAVMIAAAINPAAKINSAKQAVAEAFSSSIQNSLGFDLAGEWTFDDGTAKDTSGYGNNGTVYGATLTADRKGIANKAYSFNGSNWIQTNGPRLSNISGNKLTVEAWIKPNVLTGYILIKNGPIAFRISGGKLVGGVHTVNIYWPTVYGIISLNTNWTHVAMTYDGNYIKLYVNGVFDNSLAVAGGDLAGDGCVEIGRSNNGGCGGGVAGYFNGLIDDVRIYKSSLLSSQIRQLYAQGLINHQMVFK